MTALNWHDEQRRNLPPKDETWRDRANCRGVDVSEEMGTSPEPPRQPTASVLNMEGPGESPNRPRSKSEPLHKERT